MGFKPSNIAKYLARHAEPEASLRPPPGIRYAFAVIVPARGETDGFMRGWTKAIECLPHDARVLFAVVVNSDAQTPAEYRVANDALLTSLRERPHRNLNGHCPTFLVPGAKHDVLVVDRHSEGYQLPPKTGVGLARKLASDIVCAWIWSGSIANPWWLSTDADVTLPADLAATWAFLPPRPGIGCLPFEHMAGGESEVNAATLAVEVKLRYHVMGLRYAGSSFAWPALGSCLAIHVEAYAAARGFPKRLAGEDFYLIEKVSKIAPVYKIDGSPVQITARRSRRAPFGTGPSVEELLDAGEVERVFTLRHPACYEWLKELLGSVEASVRADSEQPFRGWLTDVKAKCPEVAGCVGDSGLLDELTEVMGGPFSVDTRRARLVAWFDGLRQVQFLKALEQSLPAVFYREALSQASFLPRTVVVSDLSSAVHWLRQLT